LTNLQKTILFDLSFYTSNLSCKHKTLRWCICLI